MIRSRLQKTQLEQVQIQKRRKQLWLQIIALLISIIVLIWWFLLMAFPMMVRETGRQNSAKAISKAQVIRPQTPMLNVPSAFTNQSELHLSGYGQPDTILHLVVNEVEKTKLTTKIGMTGEFSLTLTLIEGENILYTYSVDDDGNRSLDSKIIKVILDQQIPKIDLYAPTEDQEIIGKDKQILQITGQTEPRVQVLINNIVVWADNDGNFTYDYSLQAGENKLKITAIDQAENQFMVERMIYFEP